MKKFLKRLAFALVLALTVIVAVAVYRTVTFTSMQITPEPGVLPGVNIERATAALSEAVQVQTFSSNDPAEMNPEIFLQLHAALERHFPWCTRGCSGRRSAG